MSRRAPVLGAAAVALAGALTAAAPATAAPRPATPLNYVALGDSYASAPGVPEEIDAACARSSGNYPHILADKIKARLTDVSCSGATTADLAAPQGTAPAQFTALNRKTDLVTVTIGGNDIGFTPVLTRCAVLSQNDPAGSPCRDDLTAGGTDQVEQSISATAAKVAQVVSEIRARAPRAKVLMVGYPSIFPDDGVGCTSPTAPFAAGDFAYLRDKAKSLNAMIARVARTEGASYVDTYRPTVGHDMCRSGAERWIEDFSPQNPAAPLHPNARGELAMGRAVHSALAKCGWKP
ncbi:SGNH/GDSL hydrolase family protein [Streptomyces sp. NPDC018964]|uniref:SGNH/GDSL hydrolase family protein n=1 Tax=unclassified Streptomyces TaxID=2593676 RepID=UPI0037BDA54D